MSYNARDVLHASLVLDLTAPGEFEVIESSGVDRDSIAILSDGVFEFSLTDAIANTEENLGTDAHSTLDPGPPPLTLPLPHCCYAPLTFDPDDFDPARRRFIVRDFDGAVFSVFPIRCKVQLYQFNQGQQG